MMNDEQRHSSSSVHHSSFIVHRFSLRLGLCMLHGMSAAHAERIEQARRRGPFRSLQDFTQRTGLSRAVASRLAKAGAFGSLGLGRRDALWHALAQDSTELPLLDRLQPEPEPAVALPEMSPAEQVLADYRTVSPRPSDEVPARRLDQLDVAGRATVIAT